MNTKNLKVKYIDIQNFKNIDYASVELGDWNIIGGFNGNGKSSFVEAILAAIQGNKFYGNGKISPASLVRSGEHKAIIKLQLQGGEEELIIERIFTTKGKNDFQATLNGKEINQSVLNDLLNNLTLDPLRLSNLTNSEQIKEIKETIGLDTSEIDKKIKEQEEATKETRAFDKQAKNVYEDFTSAGIPTKIEEKSINNLMEHKKMFEVLNEERLKYDLQAKKVENLKEQLKEAEKELEVIKQNGSKQKQVIKDAGLTTLEDLDKEISEVEEHNNKARQYQEFLKKKEQMLKAQEDFKKDEEKLEALRNERTKMIANSNIPDYMQIDEDLGILVDGIEYKLINTARKIEVAIDLVLISGSPLRMIRIEQGGEIDTKTLEKIKDKILKNDFCLFLERPIIDKYDTIIINDGEVLEGEEKQNFINNQ